MQDDHEEYNDDVPLMSDLLLGLQHSYITPADMRWWKRVAHGLAAADIGALVVDVRMPEVLTRAEVDKHDFKLEQRDYIFSELWLP